MSSPLAIAGVTAVLRDLLINGLIDHDLSPSVGDVTVSALPPDRITPSNGQEPSQLNLFLYRVTPNIGWSNVGLASRDGRGERLSNPPLALDLHYLLTAYGAMNFHSEILLGYAMHLLHEHPALPRDAIRTALSPPSPASAGGGLPDELLPLSTCNLADQMEQIKITPESLSTEEISKLWSAFQTNYRPTAAYQVSVVLIELHRPTRSALPVRRVGRHVRQLRHPFIDSLSPQFVNPGGELQIHGHNLKAALLRVGFGELSVTPAEEDVQDDAISVTVPAGLQAGINTAQVIHELDFETPNVPHRGFESNVAAFVLRPSISVNPPQNVTDLGNNLRSVELPLSFDPEVGKTQRVMLLLNEFNPPPDRRPRAYSFEAPLRNQPSDPDSAADITFTLARVHAGTYVVRVQVDGGESELFTNAQGMYASPEVIIP
jgi:hypothetical protein